MTGFSAIACADDGTDPGGCPGQMMASGAGGL